MILCVNRIKVAFCILSSMHEAFINFAINIVRFSIESVMSSIEAVEKLLGMKNAFTRSRSESPRPSSESTLSEHRQILQKPLRNRMERALMSSSELNHTPRINTPQLIADDPFDNAQVYFFPHILFLAILRTTLIRWNQ